MSILVLFTGDALLEKAVVNPLTNSLLENSFVGGADAPPLSSQIRQLPASAHRVQSSVPEAKSAFLLSGTSPGSIATPIP
jgi:hypothetical protein